MYHTFTAAKGDSLCPLGFHPQVRWPTRCKRCFRDYKDHENRKKIDVISNTDNHVNGKIVKSNSLDNSKERHLNWAKNRTHSLDFSNEIDNVNDIISRPTSWTSTPDLRQLNDNTKANDIPTVNFTLPIKRTKSNDFNTNVTLNHKITTNSINNVSEKSDNRIIYSRDILRKYRKENEDLRNQLNDLQNKYEKIEKEKSDMLLKHLNTVDSKSSKKFHNEILISLQENCKEFQSKNEQLLLSKINLDKKVKKLEEQLKFERNNEELRTKLVATESLCEELMGANEDIKKEMKDLEEELEEMQDSFCDDFHSDEYSILKKDLEQSNKNCRILSFKLRKYEKKLDIIENEKNELQQNLKVINDAQSILAQSERLREQEEQLNLSNQLIIQLQNDLQLLNSKLLENEKNSVSSLDNNNDRNTNPKLESIGRKSSTEGIKVSRESLIRSNSQDDPIQLYRDLQDSIEREFDFKEQLKFSEEEAQTLRKKLTRLEDENESLMLQLKKMCTKSHKPLNSNDIDQNTTDENTTELKVLLELNEQECSSLRKKVLEYESEMEILRNKIKEYDEKSKTKLKNKRKLAFDQDDCNTFNDIEPKNRKMKFLTKSRSLDTDQQTIDFKCQLKVVEQEVSVLRTKIQSLENENEKLVSENTKYQSICNRKRNRQNSNNFEELNKQIAQLKTDLDTSNNKIQSLFKENEQLKKSHSDQSIVLKKIENEKQQISSRLQLLKENSKSYFNNRVPKVCSEFMTKSQLRKMIEELENEISEVIIVLKISDEKCLNLENQLNTIKNSDAYLNYDKVYNQLKQYEKEIRKSDYSIIEKKDQIENNKNYLPKKQRNFVEVEKQYKELKNDFNKLQIENSSLKENLSKSENIIKEFEQKINQLSSCEIELSNLRKEANRLKGIEDEKHKMSKELAENEIKITKLDNVIKEIKDKWKWSEKLLINKKEKIQELMKQIKQYEEERNEFKEKFATDNDKISKLENEIDKKNDEIKKMELLIRNENDKYLENNEFNKIYDDCEKYKVLCNELEIKINVTENRERKLQEKIYQMKKNHDDVLKRYETDDLKNKDNFEKLCMKYDKLENELLLLKSKENIDFEHENKFLKEKLINFEIIEKERAHLQLLTEQKNQEIIHLKKDIDHFRIQIEHLKKDNDQLKKKLDDFNKLLSIQNRNKDTSILEDEIKRLKNEINDLQKTKNSSLQEIKDKYENQLSLSNNEVKLLENQIFRLKKEKNNFKDTLDLIQRNKFDNGNILKNDQNEIYKAKVKNLEDQIYNLENDLSEAKEDLSKMEMTLLNERNANELRMVELKSKLNELEEERILTSGRTKLIGLKTRIELAWQKERNEQQKLLQETTTLARDLRQTLFEIERERDKEKLETKRKFEHLKKMTDKELEENQNKINCLQQMIFELRDSQAKIRTQNEKLKHDLESNIIVDNKNNIKTKHILFSNNNFLMILIDKIYMLLNLIPEFHRYFHQDSLQTPIAPKRRKNLVSRESSPNVESKSETTKILIREILEIIDNLKRQSESKTDVRIGNNLTRPKLKTKSSSLDQYQNNNHICNNYSFDYHSSLHSIDNTNLMNLQKNSLNSSNDSDFTESSRISNDSIQSEIIHKKKKPHTLMGRLKKLTKSKSVDHNDFKLINFLNDRIDFKDTFTNIFKKSSKSNIQNISSKNSEISYTSSNASLKS